MLKQHCHDCHGREKTKGKVDLTSYRSWEDLEKNPELIENLIEVVGKNEMPPEDSKQPTATQREAMLLGLEKAFKSAMAHRKSVTPLRLRRTRPGRSGGADSAAQSDWT